ncbi:fork head domain-containing protein [Colletotrichum scovillei]|uniref:Fork head domain-containing protein n=1 Tax=Colletotrichum scovillei TaxID=1209932 RepID=A0A9P7RER2_9PEZI|nr:fork head domain-containing protein [Colletotrichum scovillei]KAF4783764.1 fork head domain-containing protein [Colletotrichum scovillei]KAG7054289.1 fork head domain-containing protein [Colletotrichum scovillei]KAG7072582.1 fork head domain-containing protein [Colletotrichum scovillei]KAG7080681.1 fork head domain-containing protein [Colletotrichum scovillei]
MTAKNSPQHNMRATLTHQQQSNNTQSSTALAVKTDMVETYNTMAPEQQPQQQQLQQRPFTVQDPQPYYTQLTAISQHQYPSPVMNQTTWSSPQSMSTDEFDNYSYRGQAVQSAYNPASLSPRSWPSSTQTPPPVQASQYELPIRSQDPAFGLANDHLTMSPETLRGTDLNVSLHYSNSDYPHGFEQRHFDPEPLQRTLESDRVHYASSPGTDAPGSPYGGSPTSFHVGDLPDVIPDLGGQSPSTKANPQPDAANNNGEGPPYAKLIHRALKNAPDHSMTLQELYKWFRDNTNKPQRTEKNGWQNSIRHNLSMNDAFQRREKEIFTQPDGHTSNEKRVSEWYLNPKYLDDILPTTHFRDGNRGGTSRSLLGRRACNAAAANANALGGGPMGMGRRNSPPRSSTITHYPNPDYPNRSMPGRAMSGRRGGRATTNSRNARRQRSQTGSMSPVMASQHHHQHHHHQQQLPPHMQIHEEMMRRSQVANEQCFQQQQQREMQARGGPLNLSPISPTGTVIVGSTPGGGNITTPTSAPGPFMTAAQPYQFQGYAMADVSGVYSPSTPTDGAIYGWGSNAQL